MVLLPLPRAQPLVLSAALSASPCSPSRPARLVLVVPAQEAAVLDVLAQKAVPMCALVRRPPSAAVTSASAACATCALCGRCGGADSRQHCRVPPWQRKRPTTRPATPVPNGHCYPYMQLSGAAAAIEVALMVRQDLPISASVFCSIHPVTPAAAVEVVLHGQRASESAYHGLIRGEDCPVMSLATLPVRLDRHWKRQARRDLRVPDRPGQPLPMRAGQQVEVGVPQIPQTLSPPGHAALSAPEAAGTRCTGAQRRAAHVAPAPAAPATAAEALHCFWPETRCHIRCRYRT